MSERDRTGKPLQQFSTPTIRMGWAYIVWAVTLIYAIAATIFASMTTCSERKANEANVVCARSNSLLISQVRELGEKVGFYEGHSTAALECAAENALDLNSQIQEALGAVRETSPPLPVGRHE